MELFAPTTEPTELPSQAPSTSRPTDFPSTLPSQTPSLGPSNAPVTTLPSRTPSSRPSLTPSTTTTALPSQQPSESPPPRVKFTFIETLGCYLSKLWGVDTFDDLMQLSQITFLDANGFPIPYVILSVSPEEFKSGEGPENLADGLSTTKFLDCGWVCSVDYTLEIEMELLVRPESYFFTTANDVPNRDPRSWTMTLWDRNDPPVSVTFVENPPNQRQTDYQSQAVSFSDIKRITVNVYNLNRDITITNVGTITVSEPGTYLLEYGYLQGERYIVFINSGDACTVPSNNDFGLMGDQDIVIEVMCTLKPTKAPTTSLPTGAPSVSLPSMSPSIKPSNDPTTSPLIAPFCEDTDVDFDAWLLTLSEPSKTLCKKLFDSIYQLTPAYECSCFNYVTPNQADQVFHCFAPDSREETLHQRWKHCQPTMAPTGTPTFRPSYNPSVAPTLSPTVTSPTNAPTTPKPTKEPSEVPSVPPTSSQPSTQPSGNPSVVPTSNPSFGPSVKPTFAPSHQPTISPFASDPTVSPSQNPTRARGFSLEFTSTRGCDLNRQFQNIPSGFEEGISLGELKLYDSDANQIQISIVYDADQQPAASWTAVDKLVDGDSQTSWFDVRFQGSWENPVCDTTTVRITALDTFGVTEYELFTSASNRNRDPTAWIAETCSSDGCTRVQQSHPRPPNSRSASYGRFSFEPIDIPLLLNGIMHGAEIYIQDGENGDFYSSNGLHKLPVAKHSGDSYSVSVVDENCFVAYGEGTISENMIPVWVRCNTGLLPCTSDQFAQMASYAGSSACESILSNPSFLPEDVGCSCFFGMPEADALYYLSCYASASDEQSLYQLWSNCQPSASPSLSPTNSPSTHIPSTSPISSSPTISSPSYSPSVSPSKAPSDNPSTLPSDQPSSSIPTFHPSLSPTRAPSLNPYVLFTFNGVRGCLKNEEWGGHLIFNNGFVLADITFFDREGNVISWQHAELLVGSSIDDDSFPVSNLADQNPETHFASLAFNDDCSPGQLVVRIEIDLSDLSTYVLTSGSIFLASNVREPRWHDPTSWDFSLCEANACRTIAVEIGTNDYDQGGDYPAMPANVLTVSVEVISLQDPKGLTATFLGERLHITQDGVHAFTTGILPLQEYAVTFNAPNHCHISNSHGQALEENIIVIVDCTTETPSFSPTVYTCELCASSGTCANTCLDCLDVCEGESDVDQYLTCSQHCESQPNVCGLEVQNVVLSNYGIAAQIACLSHFMTPILGSWSWGRACDCMWHIFEADALESFSCAISEHEYSLLVQWHTCNSLISAPTQNPSPKPSKSPTPCPPLNCECALSHSLITFSDDNGCNQCYCRGNPTVSPSARPSFTSPSKRPSTQPSLSDPTMSPATTQPTKFPTESFPTASPTDGNKVKNLIT